VLYEWMQHLLNRTQSAAGKQATKTALPWRRSAFDFFLDQLTKIQIHLTSVWIETRSGLNLPKEQLQAQANQAFEKAKGISHFLQMLVVLTFIMTLGVFCLAEYRTASGWVNCSTSLIAAVFFLALAAYLWFWICSVLFYFLWEEISGWTTWCRSVTVFLLFVQLLCIAAAVYNLAVVLIGFTGLLS
jgi:hypothetical protein